MRYANDMLIGLVVKDSLYNKWIGLIRYELLSNLVVSSNLLLIYKNNSENSLS
jgi:hypothetical protein